MIDPLLWLQNHPVPALNIRIKGTDDSQEQIHYGYLDTTLGRCLVAFSGVGLCRLEPVSGKHPEAETALLAEQVNVIRDDEFIRDRFSPAGKAITLDLCGTAFQVQVWEALTHTVSGERLTYGALASQLGMPSKTRAVAGAVAANRIACFVPCHRIVPATGGTGNYRWGADLKARLLREEALSADRLSA